jgi:hypothetical protein
MSKKSAEAAVKFSLHIMLFLLGLMFYPKDGGDICLRNVGLSPNYTALRRENLKSNKIRTCLFYVGFEVFTAVVMKSIVFWDMTPCSPLSVNRRFGGTYRLHLQGRKK